MAVKLAYKTTLKMKDLKSKVSTSIKSEREFITKQFIKRKKVIERYMNHAPLVRFMDKVFFIFGVLLVIITTFLLGRRPNDIYYTYHVIVIISLVAIRLINYRIKKWHYYLFDFCYFANALIVYFLMIDPKNDILFKVFFVYANGPFGLAIPAFKNSMIFHKIDNLTSIAIHIIPLATSWNLRWTTLAYEKTLKEEDRYFLTLPEDDQNLDFNFFNKMFLIPFALYLLWALLYYVKVFIVSSKKIADRNYETMFIYYMNQ
jgi:hypothetical protein